MRYFFPIASVRFHGAIAPALAKAWTARSFAPAFDLCRELAPIGRDFIQQRSASQTEPMVVMIAGGTVPFRRDLWRLLCSEFLLFSAAELPELETPAATWAILLHQSMMDERPQFSPIQQAIQGSRDLSFGGAYYRPDHAGWNDLADVQRLSEWMTTVDIGSWKAEELTEFDESDRVDELAFAKEWFPALREIYRRAAANGWIVVCEDV
jgi:hypothetical protein